MTDEEAIKKLKEQQNEFNEHCIDYAGINEAYNMAIEALKSWEKVITEIKKESEVETLKLHWGKVMGLNKAIEIIDKYNEKSENKEAKNG